MPIISVEKLNNANLDAETIEQVVNGEPNVLVESREGRKIPTLATLGEKHLSAGVILYGEKTQEQVNDEVGNALTGLSFANKTYTTLAAANADIANIAVNQSVWVSSATEGGLYEKKTAGATSLTKSAFDPISQLSPKELLSNSDVNDYQKEGTYVIRQTGAANTISNLPEACILSSELGSLWVVKKPGDSTTRQAFFSTEGFIASRLYRDNIWSSWSLGASATKPVVNDLTDITTLKSGVHLILDTVSTGITNFPPKAKGKACLLHVIKVAQNNYAYILNDLTAGSLHYADASLNWTTLAGANSESLSNTTNLNSIIQVGKYYCRFVGDATQLNNYPSFGKTGYLEVSRHKTDNSIYQKYVDADNKTFRRMSTNGGSSWSKWFSVASDLNKSSSFADLDVIDFTDNTAVSPKTVGSIIKSLTSSKSGFIFSGNTGAAQAAILDFVDGQTALSANGSASAVTNTISSALLSNYGQTLLISYKYSDSATKQAIYYQQQPGATGRLQVVQNGLLNGGLINASANMLQVFVGGASDGAGNGGNIKAVEVKPDVWNTIILYIGNGVKASKLWVNNELVDSFTCPPILNVNPTVIPELSTISPLKVGRIAQFIGLPTSAQVKQFTDYMISGYSNAYRSDDVVYESYTFESVESISINGSVSECLAAMICTDDGSFIPENVLYSKQTTYLKRIASITKVMTFLVLLDQDFKLNDVISRTSYDENAGSGLNIEIGDQIYLQDALYNLMLPSSNITANIIARTYGHKILIKEGVTGATDAQAYMRWIKAMNDKATLLEMGTAKFYSASGYGNDTAYPIDILKMMNEAVKHPLLMKVWRTVSYSFKVINTSRLIAITNTNNLLANNSRVIGGKTGSGDGYHVACLSVLDDGRYLASVALNSPTADGRFNDIRLLLDQL